MKLSDAGVKLIASFEGLRTTAYQDVAGIWTIGYGHTEGVHPDDIVTPSVALAMLDADAGAAASDVDRLVRVSLNQNQFDALTSFVYNIGPSAFSQSTLLRKLNVSDYAGAADQFLVWDHAGGKMVAGLLARRKAERAYFLSPVVPDSATVSS